MQLRGRRLAEAQAAADRRNFEALLREMSREASLLMMLRPGDKETIQDAWFLDEKGKTATRDQFFIMVGADVHVVKERRGKAWVEELEDASLRDLAGEVARSVLAKVAEDGAQVDASTKGWLTFSPQGQISLLLINGPATDKQRQINGHEIFPAPEPEPETEVEAEADDLPSPYLN